MNYSVLLHEKRKQLDLSAIEYLIADAIFHAAHPASLPVTKLSLAEYIGVDAKTIQKYLNALHTKGILEQSVDFYDATDLWVDVVVYNKTASEQEVLNRNACYGMTLEVIAYLNEKTGKNYPTDGTYVKNIQTIMKDRPKVMVEHFHMVVDWAIENWQGDKTMQKYIRPATLFRSTKKFVEYFVEAKQHFASGSNKKDSALV